ncbi:MAG: hypothetical protein EXQ85_05075 [Alphaproteobacteria bacterium]|nr:hypothetical protein [Alphaproteobacteria bacterium]
MAKARGKGKRLSAALKQRKPVAKAKAPPPIFPPSAQITPREPTYYPTEAERSRPEGWSAPFLSSPYNEPPHPMESAKMLIVEFWPDPQALIDAVPYPLEALPDLPGVAICGDNRQMPTSLKFQEGMIVLPVKFGNQTGSFTPYIWTSTDEAMIAAREISGRPKTVCDHNEIQEVGSQAMAKITRRGETLLRVSVTLEKHGNFRDLPFGGNWFSVRKVQMPERDRPALKQVIHHGLGGSFKVFSIWQGRGFCEMPGQAFSAVWRLNPKKIGRAWYAHVSWDLDFGKIVWEHWVPALIP